MKRGMDSDALWWTGIAFVITAGVISGVFLGMLL